MSDERGSVTAFVAVVAFALIAVAGMVADGGSLLASGIDAGRLASAAARAGAQEVDLDALRAGGRPTLAAGRASRASREFLAAAGADGTVTVTASTVTVAVTLEHRARLLPLPTRAITATRSARAVTAEDLPGDAP
jgi:Flp pilus assembly protein TadG